MKPLLTEAQAKHLIALYMGIMEASKAFVDDYFICRFDLFHERSFLRTLERKGLAESMLCVQRRGGQRRTVRGFRLSNAGLALGAALCELRYEPRGGGLLGASARLLCWQFAWQDTVSSIVAAHVPAGRLAELASHTG